MSQNSYAEEVDEVDDEVEEVYSVRRGITELVGGQEHLQMFLTSDQQFTTYFQTFGGGPEGGYFERVSDDGVEIYAASRSWGVPFTVTRIYGQLIYTPQSTDDVATVRFVQDNEENWRLP